MIIPNEWILSCSLTSGARDISSSISTNDISPGSWAKILRPASVESLSRIHSISDINGIS